MAWTVLLSTEEITWNTEGRPNETAVGGPHSLQNSPLRWLSVMAEAAKGRNIIKKNNIVSKHCVGTLREGRKSILPHKGGKRDKELKPWTWHIKIVGLIKTAVVNLY